MIAYWAYAYWRTALVRGRSRRVLRLSQTAYRTGFSLGTRQYVRDPSPPISHLSGSYGGRTRSLSLGATATGQPDASARLERFAAANRR